MEKLKISDLLDYKFLSGIVASPSGKKAAFLARQANKEKNSYDSWAYIADFCTGEVRKLTSFGAESHLLFDSEDTLLFSSVRKHEDKAKDGKEKTIYIYNVCDHQECYKEVGSQAVSYTTGVPAMIGAMMMVTGKWNGKGVFNVEEFDPDPYMEALNKWGLPWVVDENPQTVE